MKKDTQRTYDLEDRLIEFAVGVCSVVESLPASFLGKHISNQLLRSGTAPAPNYGEAQAAESRKDFVHKMRICLKELRETCVWLMFIQRKELLPAENIEGTLQEGNELIAIFVSSIKIAHRNDHR